MYGLSYEITTLSPVVIPAHNEDKHMTHTLDYIPGSTILGLLASRFVHARSQRSDQSLQPLHLNDQFYGWFLEGKLIFSNAYLSHQEENTSRKRHLLPVPLSLCTEKNRSSNEVFNKYYLPKNNPTRSIHGYAVVQGESIEIKNPQKQLNFHHQRSRSSGRIKGYSDDGGIFHYESLDEGQSFSGWIIGEKEMLDSIKHHLESDFEIRLGRSKNAQYGHASFCFQQIEPLDEIYKSIHADRQIWEDILEEQTITLTCLSPMILYNQFGYPEISSAILEDYLKESVEINDLQVGSHCYTASRQIENYVSVWQMKKPLDRCFNEGSTFQIHFNQPIDDHILNKIKNLIYKGIGERKHEGFGRVIVQWAEKDQYTTRAIISEVKLRKPQGEPTKETIHVFHQLLRKHLMNKVIRQAIKVANQFGNGLPTSHLLGRLELILRTEEAKEDHNPTSIVQQIVNLNEHSKAIEQLTKCRTDNASLYDLLTEHIEQKILDDTLNNQSGRTLKQFFEQNDYFDITKDPEILMESYFVYWKQVFRQMRRMNKLNKKGGGG